MSSFVSLSKLKESLYSLRRAVGTPVATSSNLPHSPTLSLTPSTSSINLASESSILAGRSRKRSGRIGETLNVAAQQWQHPLGASCVFIALSSPFSPSSSAVPFTQASLSPLDTTGRLFQLLPTPPRSLANLPPASSFDRSDFARIFLPPLPYAASISLKGERMDAEYDGVHRRTSLRREGVKRDVSKCFFLFFSSPFPPFRLARPSLHLSQIS